MEFDVNRWQPWIVYIAGGVAILVGILSWNKGIFLEWLILRMILSFALIYILCWGSIVLFNKKGPEKEDSFSDTLAISDDQFKGNLVDVAVGSDEDKVAAPMPGQVDSVLSTGQFTSEQQADALRRMGWGDKE